MHAVGGMRPDAQDGVPRFGTPSPFSTGAEPEGEQYTGWGVTALAIQRYHPRPPRGRLKIVRGRQTGAKRRLGATPKAHSGPLSRASRIGLACERGRSDTRGRHDATRRSTAEAADIAAAARRSACSRCTAGPTSRSGGVTPRPIT